jgi:hypothetical protein
MIEAPGETVIEARSSEAAMLTGGEPLELVASLGVLAIWLVLAALLARAVFRWEPRKT